MKAIGGYFEIECGSSPSYHSDGIYLNLCRSAIRYLIRTLGIKRIHTPVYTCHVVLDAIRQENCEIIKYELNSDMLPGKDFPQNDYIIYNNYFGTVGNNVKVLSQQYPNLIVDNAQAFYSNQECRAAIYSPRKFFGLPDGGILKGKDIPALSLNKGQSYDICSHLLKRADLGAQAAYNDFVTNDTKLEEFDLETMSGLTKSLMGNIDYENCRRKRLENFRFLQQNLDTEFPLAISDDDVPLIFPYLVKNGAEIRSKLIDNNVFCARYWPEILKLTTPGSVEYEMANNLVCIPIDQRYGLDEMKYIVSLIK